MDPTLDLAIVSAIAIAALICLIVAMHKSGKERK